jgi:hypothetical protein
MHKNPGAKSSTTHLAWEVDTACPGEGQVCAYCSEEGDEDILKSEHGIWKFGMPC